MVESPGMLIKDFRAAASGDSLDSETAIVTQEPLPAATKDHAHEALRPNTMPSDSSTTAFRFRKNRNAFRSISMLLVCRTRSGITMSSSPSCLTTWYGARFRLPTWVSTDTSAVRPDQDVRAIKSITARPPFFTMWSFAFSLTVMCIV